MSFTSTSEKPLKAGLYVISVPIGNLQDITLRALDTLKKLNKIYCEDTRITRKLLTLYQIPPPQLIRCDDVMQESATISIKDDIHNGLAVGLVSDAGTPLISDPGYVILASLRKDNLPIYPIGGVCAAIAALSVSGLPTFSFQFMGFVPKKQKQRQEIIDHIGRNPNSYIFYERPERIKGFLQEFPENLQQADCFIAREMTKLHEDYYSAPIKDILKLLETMSQKGEAVLIIATHNQIYCDNNIDISSEIITLLREGDTIKDVIQNKKLLRFVSRNELYTLAQKLKNDF